jgi:hypothetical protein
MRYVPIIIRSTCLLLLVTVLSCSKGGSGSGGSGGGGTTTPTEANLSVSLNPDPGAGVASALSGSYAFKLVINSTPPANGVRIDITGTKDIDNSVQFSQTSQTSSASATSVDLNLSNLAQGILYNVKVDVTSLTLASNKTSVSFKVARK